MAYYHSCPGGLSVNVSNVEQIETLIKWAGRLLYVEIFISLMIVMGYWHIPLTFAFIGAVGSLSYVGFHWIKKEEEIKKEE